MGSENTPDAVKVAEDFCDAKGFEDYMLRAGAILGARAMQAAIPAPAGVRVEALMEFARGRIREAWEGCEDGDEIQDHARRLGLIVEAPGGYDPKKHGTQGEAEPGEPWFVFADWLKTDAIEDAGAREGAAEPLTMPVAHDPRFPSSGGTTKTIDGTLYNTPTPAGAGNLVERNKREARIHRDAGSPDEYAALLLENASRIEALEAENFALAAGACLCVKGDERGNAYCEMKARAALAPAKAGEAEGWRSLDDCPSDGTPVWLAVKLDNGWTVESREADGEWWRDTFVKRQCFWMPRQTRPAPPSAQGGGDGE